MVSNDDEYSGFEQGPIRPPSEAGSLLIRITRNCPWNRCRFCPVYKGRTFSLRTVAHVIEDIDRVYFYVEKIRKLTAAKGRVSPDDLQRLDGNEGPRDRRALNAAYHWLSAGMQSIFLQDANSLIIKPERMIAILDHLRLRFPEVDRITSYARSHTIARISDDHLRQIRQSGLTRIHIGMESGSDAVLARVQKGVDKQTHIVAGKKVKSAGMELSEYVMPGLGGRELSREHALESADALNQINPDFIRLRTLAIPNRVELYQDLVNGTFTKLTEIETARELQLFLTQLENITSHLKSDHILNLFEDLDGTYPEDKERLVQMVETFLSLEPEEQMIYQVGRRMGLFHGLDDLDNDSSRPHVVSVCREHGVRPGNVDMVIGELMKRFI